MDEGLNTVFPPEILRQFVRNRSTLAVFRCTCREFAGLTIAGRWTVRVVLSDANSKAHIHGLYDGTGPYMLSPIAYPWNCGYVATIIAGDRQWPIEFHHRTSQVRRKFARVMAREFLLIEQNPLIPYFTTEEIGGVLVDCVGVDGDYYVVVEPPIWDYGELEQWEGYGPLPSDSEDDPITVTLLARASVITADTCVDTCTDTCTDTCADVDTCTDTCADADAGTLR